MTTTKLMEEEKIETHDATPAPAEEIQRPSQQHDRHPDQVLSRLASWNPFVFFEADCAVLDMLTSNTGLWRWYADGNLHAEALDRYPRVDSLTNAGKTVFTEMQGRRECWPVYWPPVNDESVLFCIPDNAKKDWLYVIRSFVDTLLRYEDNASVSTFCLGRFGGLRPDSLRLSAGNMQSCIEALRRAEVLRRCYKLIQKGSSESVRPACKNAIREGSWVLVKEEEGKMQPVQVLSIENVRLSKNLTNVRMVVLAEPRLGKRAHFLADLVFHAHPEDPGEQTASAAQ